MTTLEGETDVAIDAEGSIGKNSALKTIFEKMTELSGSFTFSTTSSGGIQGNKIAKTILENSLLYDFLDTVELRKKNYLVDITENYTLEISEN